MIMQTAKRQKHNVCDIQYKHMSVSYSGSKFQMPRLSIHFWYADCRIADTPSEYLGLPPKGRRDLS